MNFSTINTHLTAAVASPTPHPPNGIAKQMNLLEIQLFLPVSLKTGPTWSKEAALRTAEDKGKEVL